MQKPISPKNKRAVFVALSAILACALGRLCFCPEGYPLPFTFQNMVIVLASAVFGGFSGGGVTGLFLTAGALGLPVFAFGAHGTAHLSGINGGFLIGYFISALVTGFYIGEPKKDAESTPLKKTFLACALGYAVIYIPAMLRFLDAGIPSAIALFSALKPYALFDLVKLCATVPLAMLLRPHAARHLY